MANYNITLSDGVTVIPIPDGSTTFTAADIPLVGQNTQLYGSPVATAFLYHLENFANGTAPSVNPLIGQLWYDDGSVTTTPSLNVYDGSWKRLANTGLGTTESGVLRWNDSLTQWQEEERVRITDAGALIIALDGTASNIVTVSHNGTDLNVAGTGTTDINVTGVTAVNIPSLTLTTVLDETYGGTGVITYTAGDILYASGADTLAALGVGSNGDVLTLAAGVPSWAATGAAVSALDDLSDVTLTTPANNSLLYRAAGQYIDSDIAALSFDGTDLSATQIGGIVEANLIDRAAPGTISGIATFTNNLVMSTGNITLLDNDKVIFGTGSDVAVDFDSASGDFDIAATSAVDFNITGFTGNIISSRPVHATSGGAEAFRVIGDASTWSTADSYISFYDSDASDFGLQIGTLNGGSTVNVNSRLGDLDLYASNTLAVNIGANTTTWTQNSITALVLRNAFLTGANATTSATVGDHNAVQHNVGYNETPTNTIVSSRDIDALDIGFFLTRLSSTSRTLTVTNDSDIPVGGSCIVHNAQGGGTLSISPGAVQLDWIDGSGSLPASVTRTIANNSVVTLRKVSASVWQIWGNGIS